MEYYKKVRDFLHELNLMPADLENAKDNYFIISDQSRHLNKLCLTIKTSDLLIDQFIFNVPSEDKEYQAHLFKELLRLNGELTHGAFILDPDGQSVLFHDTLALENLDLNELEASINAITLGFEEFGATLLKLYEEGN